MMDIYKLINNSCEDISGLKKVELSDLEKRKIFKNITGRNRKRIRWNGVAAAVAAAIIFAGIGISPVGAEIWSYFNGNTKEDYREDVEEKIGGKPASMEVLSVSRRGSNIRITCKFTFEKDISALAEECAEYDVPGGNVLSAPPFQNSTILINGKDLQGDFGSEAEEPMGVLMCRNTSIEENVLVQTIDIMDLDGWTADDEISLRYRDIIIGGETISGEWNYDYTVSGEKYPDEELATSPIGISAVDAWGNTYSMDSFAVTPNGIKIFGTVNEGNIPVTDTYPQQAALIRILARDNLGNEFLMYPAYPSGDGVNAVYEIYSGAADQGDDYPDEWDGQADSITVALQQEVLTWTSSTECSAQYPVISEEYVIDLSGREME